MKPTIIHHSKILDSDCKYKESLKRLPLPKILYISRANGKPVLSTMQLLEMIYGVKFTK